MYISVIENLKKEMEQFLKNCLIICLLIIKMYFFSILTTLILIPIKYVICQQPNSA